MDHFSADYILKSNTVFTGANEKLLDGFVAVKENRIAAVGTEEQMQKWMGEKTKIYSYKDKLIMPGFCDSHVHLIFAALRAVSANVITAESEEEAVKMLYNFSKAQTGEWLFGFGWNYHYWKKKRLPTKKSLDKFFSDTPVILFNEEMHSVWVNSRALELCQIDKDTPDPEGGEITKDQNGEPTGHLLEPSAIKLIIDKAFKMDPEKESQMIEEACRYIAGYGVTSISDVQVFDFVKYEQYRKLENNNKLSTRIHFSPGIDESVEKLVELKNHYCSEKLMFSGAKGFVDGTAMANTGLLLEPYLDKPDYKGYALFDEEETRKKIVEFSKNDIRVRLHACGDGAVRLALDMFENVQNITGKKLRHTIEHIENIHPVDISRFKKISVIPSVQPAHIWGVYETFKVKLGEERLKYAFAFKSLVTSGASIAFGTDCPIAVIDPMKGIYRAVTRDPGDGSCSSLNENEKLTLSEAILAYTMGSAYQMYREKDLGSLEIGKLADIIVLDRNVFNVDNCELSEAKTILTMMDGKIIFEDTY